MPSLSSILTPLEISTPSLSHTSQKHGKGEAEGGGQISHRESLTGNVGDGESEGEQEPIEDEERA